jgi:hypothetical protein
MHPAIHFAPVRIARYTVAERSKTRFLSMYGSAEGMDVDATEREQLLSAARRLGPEKFNRLVSSVGQVRTQGKLRYWQEEIIASLADTTGRTISGPGDFVAIFGKAELMPLPPKVVTRDEFFAQPNHWYYLGGAPIPDEWIAEAWEQSPEFRENVSYEFEREASKVGDLGAVRTSLEKLARILPLHRMVEIYEKVRARSPHREAEFRPTFKRVFGKRMSAFPAPLAREDAIAALKAQGFDEATAFELMEEEHSDDMGPSGP